MFCFQMWHAAWSKSPTRLVKPSYTPFNSWLQLCSTCLLHLMAVKRGTEGSSKKLFNWEKLRRVDNWAAAAPPAVSDSHVITQLWTVDSGCPVTATSTCSGHRNVVKNSADVFLWFYCQSKEWDWRLRSSCSVWKMVPVLMRFKYFCDYTLKTVLDDVSCPHIRSAAIKLNMEDLFKNNTT